MRILSCRQGRQAARRGSALAISLLVIAFICALSVGVVELQSRMDRRQSGAADRRQALYAAEAGIAEATLAVSQGRSGTIASASVPAHLGGAVVYWVESEELPGGRLLLTANGAAGSARFAVRTLVLPNVSPVGSYGFFGEERVEIGFGAVLDGYDSREGSYVSQLDPSLSIPSTGQGVLVHSNGDIVFETSPTSPDPFAPPSSEPSSPQSATEVSTPLWDSIDSGVADPAWNTGDYMIVADLLPFGAAQGSLEFESTVEEYLQLMHGVLSGSTSQREAEVQLGKTNFRVLPNVKAGVDLAIGEVSSTEVSAFESFPLSLAEYVYLLQRKLHGLSLQDLESAYVAVATGVAPTEPEAPEAPPPSAPEASTGTLVFGEVTPGPDAYVATDGTAFIQENAAPNRKELHMPAVVVPTGLTAEAGLRTVPAGEVLTLTAEDRWIDGVAVAEGGTLVLRGPVTLAVSTLTVGMGGAVIFDDSAGPIQLYTTDRLDLQPGSLVSSPAPHEAAFGTHILVGGRLGSVPGNRVTIAASGEFHGVLYAPEDTLFLPNSLRFFGAAAARELLVQDYARLSYDRAFAADGAGVPSLPKILSWQVVPLEEGLLRSRRFDPVASLRLQGIEPVASAVAAAERNFEASYLDRDGNLRQYSGDSAAFPWGDVGRLVGLRWISPATGAPLRWTRPSGYDPLQLVAQLRAEERLRIYGTTPPAHPADAAAELPPLDAFEGAELSAEADAYSPIGAMESPPVASAGIEPIFEAASVVSLSDAPVADAAPAPAPIEIADVLAALPTVDVSGISALGRLEIASNVLRGVPQDLDGDGTTSTFGLRLEGSLLTVDVSSTDGSVGDLAALVQLFDLQVLDSSQLQQDLGPLATLLVSQAIKDQSAAKTSSYSSVLSGLGGR